MVQGFSPHLLAAVRGRGIAEPTLRVVFCIALRTISQHSCSSKKPQPWSASTASKRWDFSLPFGHKRKDTPADCRPPRSNASLRRCAASPLAPGGFWGRPGSAFSTRRIPCFCADFPARKGRPPCPRTKDSRFRPKSAVFHTHMTAQIPDFSKISYFRYFIKHPFPNCESFVIIYKGICEDCVKTANENPLQNLDFWRILKTTSRDPKHGI